MSDEVLEKLVQEVVALRRRVAALETKEQPGKFAELLASGDARLGGGLYVGSIARDPDADDIWLDKDLRAGGGLALGSTSNDPVTGAIDLPEISAPATPGNNIARIYAREAATGKTNVYMKGDAGTEWAMSVGQGAWVYRSAQQTIPNATWTPVQFPNEAYDNDGCHDNVTNNTRLTVNTSGIYIATGNIVWGSNSVGVRGAAIRKNGIAWYFFDIKPPCNGMITCNTTSGIFWLTAGDYLELVGYQTSGGDLPITADICAFSMVRIGP
jgi:hypothetical protein